MDKRLDVIATVIKLGGKVTDLAQLELAYAPLFLGEGSGQYCGVWPATFCTGIWRRSTGMNCRSSMRTGSLLLDVREEDEYQAKGIEGAWHIPLPQLRKTGRGIAAR